MQAPHPHDFFPEKSDSELQDLNERVLASMAYRRSLFGSQHSTTILEENPDERYNNPPKPSSTSSISTHQRSGRSSAQSDAELFSDATSVDSNEWRSAGTPHGFETGLNLDHPMNTWPDVPPPDNGIAYNPLHSQEALRLSEERTPTATRDQILRPGRGTRPGNCNRFCTYCFERAIYISFGTKHDWKRHEDVFHETGFEWHCCAPSCSRILECEQYLKRHFKDDHRGQPVSFKKISLPPKRIYACGFENCRKITQSWTARCNDVHSCMQEAGAVWSYTRKMLNLLRYPEVCTLWKEVRSHWCEKVGIDASQLRWDPDTSHNLRIQLECLDFGGDLRDFLERVFKAGVPKGNEQRSDLFTASPSPLNAPYPPMDTFGTAPAVFGQELHFEPLLPQFSESHIPSTAEVLYPSSTYASHPPQHRNSVVMLDAPQNPSERPQNDRSLVPSDQEDMLSWQEFLYTHEYCTNTTPPLSGPPTEPSTTRPSPSRTLRRRSRSWSWLSSRRTQQVHQPIVTSHPDLALNYRLPTSTPRS